MFIISGFEVLLPTVDEFISLFPNDFKDIDFVTLCQTSVHPKFDFGNMHPCLFPGEEVETISLVPEDGRDHVWILSLFLLITQRLAAGALAGPPWPLLLPCLIRRRAEMQA